MPLATRVLCCKLFPDLPSSGLASLASLASLEAMTVKETSSHGGFESRTGYPQTGFAQACGSKWILNLGGWRGSDRDNRSHCLSSQEALLHIVFREIDSGAVGVCPKAAAFCDYVHAGTG